MDIDRTPIRTPAVAPIATAGPYAPFVWRESHPAGADFTYSVFGHTMIQREINEDGWNVYTFTCYPSANSSTELVTDWSSKHEEGWSSSRVEITENQANECWDVSIYTDGRDCDGRSGRDRAGTCKGGGDAIQWGTSSVYDEEAQRAGY